jgi:hypothetical protein
MPSLRTDSWQAMVRDAATGDAFRRLTLSAPANSPDAPREKIVARPVEIRSDRQIQVTFSGKGKSEVKNFAGREWSRQLDELLARKFTQIHVQTSAGDLHIRITRKGRVLISKGAPSVTGPAQAPRHNRMKEYPLAAEGPDAFLEAIGIKNERGEVRPSMQAKFRQINSFISLIEPLIPENLSRPLEILDCGCGSAYLTFALYHALVHTRKIHAKLTGIDKNREVIEKCGALRDRLGWEGLSFHVTEIGAFSPEVPPDLVLSLHACDTATDEAIAKGVLSNSRVIVAAPCCQHELHHKIQSPHFAAVLRHGILRERLADILTDTFRALALQITGYRTQAMEFVAPEETPKNLLLRAEKIHEPGDAAAMREYLELKQFWSVEPAIEGMLGEKFKRFE